MSIYKGTTNIGSLAVGAKTEVKQVTPSTSSQSLTPSAGYNAIERVEVDAVTASIDPNIQAANIKKDVNILGVVGTMEEGNIEIEKAFYESLSYDESNAYYFDYDIEIIDDTYGLATKLGNRRLRRSNARIIRLPSATSIGQSATAQCNYCEEFVTPSATSLSNYALQLGVSTGNSVVKKIVLGFITTFTANAFTQSTKKDLRYFEVGQDTDVAMPLGTWTATNVIAEGPSGEAELNYNIKTYLADRVKDNSGGGPTRTITFGTALYNVLTADTIAAFTDKGWSVAYA